jgi:hypothetical protein
LLIIAQFLGMGKGPERYASQEGTQALEVVNYQWRIVNASWKWHL